MMRSILSPPALFCAALLAASPAFPAAPAKGLPGVPEQPPAKSAPASAPAGQGQLPEVIIKGGEKSGVRSEKPPLELEMNADEPVLPALEPEEDLLQRSPESLSNPRAGFAESLANPRVILPARIRLAKNPVKVFYPLRDIMANSPLIAQEIGTGWEMAVTDTDGRPFRKFSGKGLPPASVEWDGRSNRGEIVGAGRTYSTVITYKDTRGQSRNHVGEPFSFDGVIHQEAKGLILTLALPSIFEPRRGTIEQETIGEGGRSLLEESADWIKRYFYTFPVRVECYSSDPALAMSRAQAVGKTLTALLLLPRGEIAANGTASDLNSERIDILITNR